MTSDVLRLTLEGPDAEPGRIPAADVARLLQGYERALGRAAEARIRRRARTGRRGGAVETATHLIFRGIEHGSLVAVLELPHLSDEDALELDDARLGELAAEDVMRLLQDPHSAEGDEWVVDALAALGDELGIGTRYSALAIDWQGPSSAARATFTADTRRRLTDRRAAADRRPARDDRLVGTLVEADFERHTAHVLTSDRQRVPVSFSEEQSDDIQMWLRRPGELEGRIEYDPRSGAMLSVELRRIVRPEQLQALLVGEDFWHHRSVDELAIDQRVHAVHDLDALVDRDATDEELAAFLDALAS